MVIRNKEHSSKYIGYGLYFYFLDGLSLRKAAVIDYPPALLKEYVSIWNWIQKYRPNKKLSSTKKRRIEEFIVDDETLIKIGSIELVWL